MHYVHFNVIHSLMNFVIVVFSFINGVYVYICIDVVLFTPPQRVYLHHFFIMTVIFTSEYFFHSFFLSFFMYYTFLYVRINFYVFFFLFFPRYVPIPYPAIEFWIACHNIVAGGGYGENSVHHASYAHVPYTSEDHAKKNTHQMRFEIRWELPFFGCFPAW